MKKTLVLATRNRGKVRELKVLLSTLPGLEVLSLDELEQRRGGERLPEVIEDGETFEANACKKAREIAGATGCAVLSDDSGLEVDALGGRPGVHSARYAGPEADDDANNAKLVEELTPVAPERRGARYRVVLAFADPGGVLGEGMHTEDGACEGHIELEPRGENGFGYDPYFRPEGYGCRMAELTPEEKNRISHRAKASAKMLGFLEGYLAGG
ncbi:MAG: RdgB/HAM1 family non-canonical purine NTP pyrophosphatase [Myxococcales bacterium]|nr:RdgB/HAM1 family non-canonical purine NTP pyrophosphatase [Myxococcales bacterium]